MKKRIVKEKSPVLVTLKAGPFAWCTCGRSSKLPFCDGTHHGKKFTMVAFKKPENRVNWLCR